MIFDNSNEMFSQCFRKSNFCPCDDFKDDRFCCDGRRDFPRKDNCDCRKNPCDDHRQKQNCCCNPCDLLLILLACNCRRK